MKDTRAWVNTGRLLFLSVHPERVEAQLRGEDLTLAAAGALRDNISTDEITPVAAMTLWDERLGRIPYTGFKVGDRCPIGRDAIRQAGISVVVGGARYGKGSSREHSPAAELAAGVQLVASASAHALVLQLCSFHDA